MKCTLLISTLVAQNNLYFESIASPGIYTPVTRALAFDANGYLYSGTNDGLYKYNGFIFSKYPTASSGNLSCPVNNIRALLFDGSSMWVGGSEGLAKLNPETNTFTEINLNLPEKQKLAKTVRVLAQLNDSVICASTSTGISLINMHTNIASYFSMPEVFNASGKNIVRSLFLDPNGKLWIGTESQGIFIFDTEVGEIFMGSKYYPALNQFSESVVSTISNYVNENFIFSADDIIYLFNYQQGSCSLFFYEKNLQTDFQSAIKKIQKVNADGDLLLITSDEGLYYFNANHNTLQQYSYDARWYNSLKENYLNDIVVGGDGMFWLATENAGIIKCNTWYSKYQFTLLPQISSNNFVVSVNDITTLAGDVWLATSEGLIQYKKDISFKTYNSTSVFSESYMQYIHVLDSNHLVFQVWLEGVGEFNINTKTFSYLQHPNIPGNGNTPVFDWLSYVDANQNYYLADFDGNYLRCNYSSKQVDTLFTAEEVDLSLPVVIPQNENILWISSSSKLYRYDLQTKQLHQIAEDGSGNTLPPVSFQEDIIVRPNGVVYLSSDEGFFKYDYTENRLKHYTINDGLPSNNCYSLFENPQGKLFISYKDGIVEFNEATEKFIVIPLPLLVASSPTPHYDGNYFYQGADNCFITANIKDLQPNTYKPQLRILAFTAGDKIISLADLSKPIILKYSDFPIVITYELIDYVNDANYILQYQLAGWDNSWINDDNRNMKALYSKINPGEYTFQLCSNNPSSTSEILLEIPFDVLSPFWQTPWFIAGVILFLLEVPYSIYRYRINELKRMHNMRNKIALDLHDEVGSSLSSIKMLSEMATLQVDNKNLLERIGNNAGESVDKMRDIIWMINPKYDQIENLSKRMEKFIAEICNAAGMDYTFENTLSTQIKLQMNQRKNTILILKEAVHNAVKYSEATHLHVHLSQLGKVLQLEVKDNGIGFNSEIIEPGNGLDSMQKRAEELKGSLQIISSPGNGTVVLLKFGY